MNRERKDGGIILKNRGGSISLMNITVEYQDIGQIPRHLNATRSHRSVIEDTKPFASI